MSRMPSTTKGNHALPAADYGRGDPMSAPDRSGEIHSQFKRLNELIRLNMDLVGQLGGRLSCVMPPEPPAANGQCDGLAHPTASPIADELRNFGGRVDAANCELQRIMERLEL